MIGARTKLVYSYGKRNQRILNVTDEEDRRKAVSDIFADMEPTPQWAPIASKMKKRENSVTKPKVLSPPKTVRMHKKKRLSPILPPVKKATRLTQIIESEVHKHESPIAPPQLGHKSGGLKGQAYASPLRAPLASFSLNVPRSPVVSTKPRKGRISPVANTLKSKKPLPPFLDVDIIVLDDDGRTIRRERRVSRKGAEQKVITQVIVDYPKDNYEQGKGSPTLDDSSEDDPEVQEPPKQPKRSSRRTGFTIYSDDDDDDVTPSLQPRNETSMLQRPSPGLLKVDSSRVAVEVVLLPAPYQIHPRTKISQPPAPLPAIPPASQPHLRLPAHLRYPYNSSPVARPRQLTPIRRRHGKNIFEPPSPPSPFTSTDVDLSLDFEELSLSDLSGSFIPEPPIPDYLEPLLEECHQETCGPVEFSSFIETFPFDPAVQSDGQRPSDLSFRKIGEASYSEVFGIGDVVLKVIPLRDEIAGGNHIGMTTNREDGPAPSDAKDVLREIIVTRAMGEVCSGFVELLKAYVVRGKYPEVLLQLWDEYHATKGSESVRPDTFLVTQFYAIIVLPNGGPDLEAYKFVNAGKMGWRQACSLFWQVAKSLAHAEQLVSFEHRDLHWGQILVKNLPILSTPPLRALDQNKRVASKPVRPSMDDPAHGVRATLIDLGLSRMDAGDGSGGERVLWTPFDDEVFMGEGDYQFDIYRIMRHYTGGTWEDFQPLTNVMWLHYLVLKLLYSKGLKPPPSSRNSSSLAFTEKDCHDCLLDVERWLGTCIATVSPVQIKLISKAKGRPRKAQAPLPTQIATPPGPSCAGEIVAYAVKRGWVCPTS